MKKQMLLIILIVLSAVLLAACGSGNSQDEQPTQDVNLIYTQAAETSQAQQALTEAAQPQPSPTQVASPTPVILATNTPLVTLSDVTPTLPQLPTLALQPTFTPLPQGDTSGTNPWLNGRPCLRAEFLYEDPKDGAGVKPKEKVKKTWRLGNSGNCTWTTEFSLVWVGGPSLGEGAISFEEYDDVGESGIPNGSKLDVEYTFKAPDSPGNYRTYFMLRDQNGTLFGLGDKGDEVFWVDIVVKPVP